MYLVYVYNNPMYVGMLPVASGVGMLCTMNALSRQDVGLAI